MLVQAIVLLYAMTAIMALPSPAQGSAGDSASLQSLVKRVSDLEDKIKKPPKDDWDKLGTVSGLISGVFVAVIGVLAATVFTKRQKELDARRSNIQTIEKFLPYLASPEPALKRFALVAISSLGDSPLAVKFAATLAGPGSVAALMDIAATDDTGSKAASVELLRLFNELLPRITKVVRGGRHIATGFVLDDRDEVGTTGDLTGEGNLQVLFQGIHYNADPVRILPEDSFFTGQVLKARLNFRVPRNFSVAHTALRLGDKVIILTADGEGNPLLRVGMNGVTGITGDLESDSQGSPVFNEEGQFLGLLIGKRIGEPDRGGFLLPLSELLEYAEGRGSLIRRIRD